MELDLQWIPEWPGQLLIDASPATLFDGPAVTANPNDNHFVHDIQSRRIMT